MFHFNSSNIDGSSVLPLVALPNTFWENTILGDSGTNYASDYVLNCIFRNSKVFILYLEHPIFIRILYLKYNLYKYNKIFNRVN